MQASDQQAEEARFLKRATNATVHIGLLLLLIAWCLRVVMPLLIPVLWAMVLAVALGPLHARLRTALGGRNKLAAGSLVVAALAVLLVPAALFVGSLVEGAAFLSDGLSEGTLTIPPPPEGVAEWPLIGAQVSQAWTIAARDAAAAAEQFAPQLAAAGAKLMSGLAGLAMGLLGFAFSIVVAGVFLAIGKQGTGVAESVSVRLLGEPGRELVNITAGTIRSVAQGVLGVAAVQALMVGVGLLFVDVPGAGLWTLLVLILAIAQLPPILVTGPIIFYVFRGESTVTASIFAVWTVVASSSDMFLKPMFLGRGLDVPMLVILVGAIGGMMAFGILGLFLGAVLLAVFHRLFTAWLQEGATTRAATESPEPAQAP